jgi:hypothetical protein
VRQNSRFTTSDFGARWETTKWKILLLYVRNVIEPFITILVVLEDAVLQPIEPFAVLHPDAGNLGRGLAVFEDLKDYRTSATPVHPRP